MIIKQIYNNNVILSENEAGDEIILVGRGIAFGMTRGSKVVEGRIEKKFELQDDVGQKFKTLVQEVPYKTILVSEEIIDYIKTQYSSYVKYNCTAVAKALLREKNTVHALQDCSLDCDEKELKEHAQKLWLTGISILDAEGNLVSEYAEDGVGYAQFQSKIEKKMLLSVIDAPKKTYVKHIEMADGSFVDIAARRCAEGAGAVLAYRHTEAEFSQKSILSVQDLLDGYDPNLMGTFLMVSDDRVMASNAPEMIGMNVMGNELIMSIRRTNQAEKLIHVNVGGWLFGGYYGVYSHGRNGYIYAYVPAKQMYSALIPNLAAALVAYVLVLLLIHRNIIFCNFSIRSID